jgi:hypothetical protein
MCVSVRESVTGRVGLGRVTDWRFVGTNIARLVAIWLAAIIVYALVFVRPVESVWVVVDLAVVGGCAYVARRTPRDVMWAAGVSLVTVLVSQLVIADKNGIWVDESNYLATLRAGRILVDGTSPFNLRWLAPIIAGPLDVFPASDANALKALNFGALVTTGTYFAWFLLRISVARRLAIASPVVLMSSYLGLYAATNRLVLDPVNYALYALMAHALVRREHGKYVPWLALVAAFNSEKIIYWFLAIAVIEYLRGGRWVRTTALAAAPTVIYLAIMLVVTRHAETDQHGFFVEQLYRMRFSPVPVTLHDPTAAATTMQMLWFPFGAFTMFALLSLVYCERWLKGLAVLLVPVLAQTLIATDTQRMTTYAFVVIVPLGAVYLTRVMRDLPRAGRWLVAALVTVIAAEHYVLPACKALREHGVGIVKVILHATPQLQPMFAALEIGLAVAIVWLHLTLAARPPGEPSASAR